MRYHVYATSFADPRDVKRYFDCRARGGSDNDCKKIGDNGVGMWGDNTKKGSGPKCALPPETMIDIWGSVEAAHKEKVLVECILDGYVADEVLERSVVCSVEDTMPHIAHITNGARIDLNPDACDALGLTPPVMQRVTYTPLHVA